jgi:ADP-ribose pyrophosphatase
MRSRKSFEGPMLFEPGESGRPRNPRGRTGTTGRGLLGKWGPNHAADPIVLRRKPPPAEGEPAHNVAGLPGGILFQMVAIKRKDTGDWAIPGGMVDDGENVSLTLRREFTEEAGALEDPEDRAVFEAQLDKIFANGRRIYEGYVDDPRNTDNAWMETTVYLFYIEDETIARELKLLGGDDASHARWLDVDSALLGDAGSLYADHRAFLQRALQQEREYLGAA